MTTGACGIGSSHALLLRALVRPSLNKRRRRVVRAGARWQIQYPNFEKKKVSPGTDPVRAAAAAHGVEAEQSFRSSASLQRWKRESQAGVLPWLSQLWLSQLLLHHPTSQVDYRAYDATPR